MKWSLSTKFMLLVFSYQEIFITSSMTTQIIISFKRKNNMYQILVVCDGNSNRNNQKKEVKIAENV